ncbi:MAG: hypothetical protein B6244_11830 [Candidatus Cloacimonetes bacterium 4572_55]|nr:MAG: hypothetical protein B6244_11830 [Candidatus Cloacimonetes bacterium 4572_55]
MKTLILAAGVGRNLRPLTSTRPKSMIKLCNKTILHHLLDMLKEVGISDVEIVIGHEGRKILDYFRYGQDFGMDINYLNQKEPTNIGDAVMLARDKFADSNYFLLVYSDIFIRKNIIKNTLTSFRSAQKPVAAVCLTSSTSLFGNIYMASDMQITRIVEKPEKSLGNYVLAGAYILPTEFFDILESENRDIEKAYSRLLKDKGLYASIWEEDWVHLGYPWDILTANQIIMNSWKEARIHRSVSMDGHVRIEGPVRIDKNVRIESGTTIKGPCYIGADSYIGNNVLIRQNSSIGEGSVVGFGVEMKNSVLFGQNRIGRLSFVGDSVVGEHTVIGSGVMTVNTTLDGSPIGVNINGKEINSSFEKLGSFIGDRVEIGAGNTLRFGSIVPSGTKIKEHFSIS